MRDGISRAVAPTRNVSAKASPRRRFKTVTMSGKYGPPRNPVNLFGFQRPMALPSPEQNEATDGVLRQVGPASLARSRDAGQSAGYLPARHYQSGTGPGARNRRRFGIEPADLRGDGRSGLRDRPVA